MQLTLHYSLCRILLLTLIAISSCTDFGIGRYLSSSGPGIWVICAVICVTATHYSAVVLYIEIMEVRDFLPQNQLNIYFVKSRQYRLGIAKPSDHS